MNRRTAENLARAEAEAAELEDGGHRINRFTDFHWRIDGTVDVWPSRQKYMRNGIVRTYSKLEDVLNKTLNEKNNQAGR